MLQEKNKDHKHFWCNGSFSANGEVQNFGAWDKDQSIFKRWSWCCSEAGSTDKRERRNDNLACSMYI